MSKVKDNLVTTGLSGKLGKQIVFRQWCKSTFLAKAPVVSQSSVVSELAKEHRLLFKEAAVYAKKAMNDPALKQAYKSKCKARQNAYARAVEDFFDSPVIGEIDLSKYTGEPESFIRIYATDGCRVGKVRVRIENEQGEEVETGLADKEGTTDWWKFIATAPTLLANGGKVIVTAYDLPGNEATKEAGI